MGYKMQKWKICSQSKFKEALSACDDDGIVEVECKSLDLHLALLISKRLQHRESHYLRLFEYKVDENQAVITRCPVCYLGTPEDHC